MCWFSETTKLCSPNGFRRNRRQLICSDKPPLQDNSPMDFTAQPDEIERSGTPGVLDQHNPTDLDQAAAAQQETRTPPKNPGPAPRKSDRVCRPPYWSADYVPR